MGQTKVPQRKEVKHGEKKKKKQKEYEAYGKIGRGDLNHHSPASRLDKLGRRRTVI